MADALAPSEYAAPARTGASFARGQSKQDYATPDDFIAAVVRRFGRLTVDLAADATNAKAPRYLDEETDSLSVDWHRYKGLLWLNPPFADVAPWARKCRVEASQGARVVLLVPAAVGSVWFATHVHGSAHVYFLSPRLSFDGKHPYPKDCVLCAYGPPFGAGYSCWRWRR